MATIVVATDDTDLFSVLRAELDAEGQRVEWAILGNEAYDLCLAQQADCLFLDVSVPGLGAFEVCALLRGDPDVPHDFPLVLLSDDDVTSRKIEQFHIAAVFPRTHAAADLREALSRIGVH